MCLACTSIAKSLYVVTEEQHPRPACTRRCLEYLSCSSPQGLQQTRPCFSIHHHSCYQLSLSTAACVTVSLPSLTAGKLDSICLSIHSFSFSHQKPCCLDPACVLPSAASSRQGEERGARKQAFLKCVHQTMPPCAPPNLWIRCMAVTASPAQWGCGLDAGVAKAVVVLCARQCSS